MLARVFAYLPFFFSQILDFTYRTLLIFIFIYFEWRDTENNMFAYLVLREHLPYHSTGARAVRRAFS